MLDLLAAGTLRPDRLVGAVTGLEDAGAALATMGRSADRPGMAVVELP